MTPEQIKQLDQDAQQYPLVRRIAALLYLEGVPRDQVQQIFSPVWISFCEIEDDDTILTPRLKELARSLGSEVAEHLNKPSQKDISVLAEALFKL